MAVIFWKRKDIILGEQKVSELTILEWKKLFSIKLFNFHKTNGCQDRFHTHAFGALSILLKGDYIEEVVVGNKIVQLNRSRKRFLYIPKDSFHRITRSNGCRTLLITGPWGKEFKEMRPIMGTLEHPGQFVGDWQIVVCGEHRKEIRSDGIVRVNP